MSLFLSFDICLAVYDIHTERHPISIVYGVLSNIILAESSLNRPLGALEILVEISIGRMVVPFIKIVINLNLLEANIVKENHIGSAVSEILRYRQTPT